MTTDEETAVRATLQRMVKVIRELGPSMSPGALASCIERNIDTTAGQILASLDAGRAAEQGS